jgi:peptidoglycan/LPS O-acetylase OafA/YrhL
MEKEKTQAKNYCLLMFELIASILIIFIHIRFPGRIGNAVESVARFGVPFFFMISGFFLIANGDTKENIRSKIKKKIKRLLILILFSEIVCFSTNIIICHKNIFALFNEFTSLTKYLFFFALNEPIYECGAHLWFLYALLYSYLIFFIFPSLLQPKSFLLNAIASLAIVSILLHVRSYGTNIEVFGKEISNFVFYRNWLLMGLPFVSFGVLLKTKEQTLKNINLSFACAAALICGILAVFEFYFYDKFYNARRIQVCFSNILFCVFLFAIALQKPLLFKNFKLINLGGNWTKYVYVIHPLFIDVFALFLVSNKIIKYLEPLAIVVLSVVFSIAVYFINKMLLVFISKHSKSAF